ncbi:MAG: hypothetical protein HGN29_12105 [Asgard group archaeon]|nr:hypothetical protein [Asgard group archaeon]
MNSNENDDLLEWDKKNITRFAQYLYNLAKEKVLEEKTKAVDDVTEEVPITETIDEVEAKKIERKIGLEEVTIGLAKAVSGEETAEEVIVKDQEDLKEIIEKEQIPLPIDEVVTTEESPELKPEIITASEILTEVEKPDFPVEDVRGETEFEGIDLEEQIKELEPVDLSQPIVTEPVINEEVFLKPEHIPEDVHKMVFIDEATSVPITEEELVPLEIESLKADEKIDLITEHSSPIEVISEVSKIEDTPVEEIVYPEPENIFELEVVPGTETVSVPEPEEIVEMDTLEVSTDSTIEIEEQVEVMPDLDDEQVKRRNEIIAQMLAETKEREKEEEFHVRDMGQTEGRAYSAVVFGQESSKNVKKWKQWERKKDRREKNLRRKKQRRT